MPRSTAPQTLSREITISGHGLHGNRPCSVRLVPVDAPTGLVFVHTLTGTEIPAKAGLAGDLVLSTTLLKDGVRLQTIEHLLSALSGLEVEHLRIEVDAEELPILDGSAAPWADAILAAGVKALSGRRRFMKIIRPVEVRNGDRWIRALPYAGLRLRYVIDFPVPALGRQSRELTLTPEKYRRELGAARTFCLAHEIDAMRARGLALGGSLDNAVVFGAEGPLNDSLRYEDEAVRHKMLDLVGDLALLGAPLLGLVEAHAAGHALHVALVQAILGDPGCWEWTEEAEPAAVRFFFQPAGLHVAAQTA
ncbi:UDP-3-O-acyl-N-acetylglucosamine deacetylase [Geothrix sp. 21YS21S-4]|uniref:UDP-3-O-acyl-N-acetylglucosamine deacetylase n=1 Tax=Geothrix sp. 21YS21S-4 TaxID=3068889 RepID=UPI0027BA1956|nr:UDP-3-O-acyl-N-acetylglucosamine deacetylase [Geothrix sp. 21YS21S-4]